jgi:hypothetical protein
MSDRPKVTDDRVLDTAAKRLITDVLVWLRDESHTPPDADTIEAYTREIRESLENAPSFDGYAIARQLEHEGWDPDSALVEILDRAGPAVNSAHEEVCAEWYKTLGKEAWPIGTKVKHLPVSMFKRPSHNLVGEIVSEVSRSGKYTVRFPQLGHIVSGSGACGTTGFILSFEELEVQP